MPRDGPGSKPVTVTWRARAFLALEVDATWTAPRTGIRPGKKLRMTRRMSDPEIAATVALVTVSAAVAAVVAARFVLPAADRLDARLAFAASRGLETDRGDDVSDEERRPV